MSQRKGFGYFVMVIILFAAFTLLMDLDSYLLDQVLTKGVIIG